MLKIQLTVFVIGFFVIMPLSQATSFYAQPFPEAVLETPVIVRGKIGMSYVDWSKDIESIKRIYTYSELQVTEVFKGSITGSTLFLREMGGEKDGIGLHIPGTSTYEHGEDVIVRLNSQNVENSYDVRGMMMGKYNIQQDADEKEYLIGAGLSENTEAEHESKTPSLGASPKKWTLDDLRNLILEQAKKDNAPAPTGVLLKTPASSTLTLNSPSTQTSLAPQLISGSSAHSSRFKSLYLWMGIIGIALGITGVILILRNSLFKK